MATTNPTVAISAPGKVLLAGGYLVLDRQYTALVFGLSARINVVTQEASTEDIIVESPQFLGTEWRYGFQPAAEGCGIKVAQIQG